MDYKKEIGSRIKGMRLRRNWRLEDLARRTGDTISLKRISSYELGERMPRPAEAVILAKALGVRAAYLMALDDIELPITTQEEALLRNWRTLAERDRMETFRHVEAMAMASRDPLPDSKLGAFARTRQGPTHAKVSK
jgi:transcriptional regulator with XRE-family HTH domain